MLGPTILVLGTTILVFDATILVLGATVLVLGAPLFLCMQEPFVLHTPCHVLKVCTDKYFNSLNLVLQSYGAKECLSVQLNYGCARSTLYISPFCKYPIH